MTVETQLKHTIELKKYMTGWSNFLVYFKMVIQWRFLHPLCNKHSFEFTAKIN